MVSIRYLQNHLCKLYVVFRKGGGASLLDLSNFSTHCHLLVLNKLCYTKLRDLSITAVARGLRLHFSCGWPRGRFLSVIIELRRDTIRDL